MASVQNSDCVAKNFDSLQELRTDFERNGYVSIKGLIPMIRLQKVEAELTETFKEFAIELENPIDSAIIELDKKNKPLLHELHNATTKLISLRSIFSIFSDLVVDISSSNYPVFEISGGYLLGIPKDDRLVYDFHQESNYMAKFESIFNFHFPLIRRSTRANGTMSVLSGSHKLGTIPFEKKRTRTDSYTNLIPAEIETIQKDFEEVHCLLEPGDCVIFHKDLVHKSNFNSSELCRPVGTARLTQNKRGSWVPKSPDQL